MTKKLIFQEGPRLKKALAVAGIFDANRWGLFSNRPNAETIACILSMELQIAKSKDNLDEAMEYIKSAMDRYEGVGASDTEPRAFAFKQLSKFYTAPVIQSPASNPYKVYQILAYINNRIRDLFVEAGDFHKAVDLAKQVRGMHSVVAILECTREQAIEMRRIYYGTTKRVRADEPHIEGVLGHKACSDLAIYGFKPLANLAPLPVGDKDKI